MQEHEPFDREGLGKEAHWWNHWRNAALRWFLQHGVEADIAEDLTQEVMLRLLRCSNYQRTISRAYLHKVCQSVLCDHLRHCQSEPPCVPLESCSPAVMLEMGYDQAEDQLLLEQALALLSEKERQIVIMHYLEEEPYEVIARALGNGATTEGVKKACQRAIKKLRQWARRQE